MANATTTSNANGSTARASWTEMEEHDLLDKFLDARNDRSMATDKGIKSKAWSTLVSALNKKHGRNLEKGQYKSKYTRLMQDYDLYKYITSLSGVGVCPDTGKPMMDDDVWGQLLESKPKQRAKLTAFRQNGFPHATICSLIAGDARATGSHATTVTALAAGLRDLEASHDSSDEDEQSVTTSTGTAQSMRPSSNGEGVTIRTSLPPTHHERVDRIKRIRGGACKSNRGKRKRKQDDDVAKALTSLMRVTTKYMKTKMAAYDKENDPSDELTGSDIQQALV
ncbi:Myb/SANT-like DNA-binding domain [Phytophthora infestans]|uniref:Myb/SANT-like DNA-binding domain n=1 Tax=Phytophthora infestans TaxID=4787 RepID=A0A833SUW3_PHYIN|nr:Myb/SANT-like DNA-binding domain [Phytophthora infestans]